MSSAYLGSLTIGGLMPGTVGLHAQLKAKINAELLAALSVNASLQANLTAGFGTNLTAAIDFVVSGKMLLALQATASVNLSASLSASLAANVALAAALQAALDAVLVFDTTFGRAGIHAWSIANTSSAIQGDASSALSAGVPGAAASDMSNGIIIATSVPSTWVALGKLLATG